MKSSNPILSRAFENSKFGLSKDRMSLNGVVNKSGFLLAIILTVAVYPWLLFMQARISEVKTLVFGSMVAGFVVALLISFRPTFAVICAPLYAVFQGIFLGGVSSLLETVYPGIAIQSMVGTFSVFGVTLLAYRLRLLRASESFKSAIFAATLGIAVVYFLSMIFQLFSIRMQLIHGNGIGGILFSLIVVGIAALNLILDFDMIEQGFKRGAPKFMEWYSAFGLMATMVWMYVEIIQLISKIRSKDS